MLDLHRMGMELGLASDGVSEHLRTALGCALFQEYLYQVHRHTRDPPMHRAVIRAKEYIEHNISGPCTLSGVAAYCNISPQHLTRIFKRDLGQTPMEYLWVLRTKQGAQMLHRSGLSVAEIAYRCGYENANHFSRRIKEQFGVRPTVLRRRRWQK